MKSKASWYQEVAVHVVVREQEVVDDDKAMPTIYKGLSNKILQ